MFWTSSPTVNSPPELLPVEPERASWKDVIGETVGLERKTFSRKVLPLDAAEAEAEAKVCLMTESEGGQMQNAPFWASQLSS